MLFKLSTLSIYLATATTLGAHAHCLFEPAIGIANNGVGVRSDVQRPNNANPCGRHVDVASANAQSTVAVAASTGAFNVNAQNFNRYVIFRLRVSKSYLCIVLILFFFG